MRKPRPKKEPLSGQEPSQPPTANALRALVTYADARGRLAAKFRASDAEIAVWLVFEQSPHRKDTTKGQLNTYNRLGEWFKWDPVLESHNISRLTGLFFDETELSSFDPANGYGRWLSYRELVARWRRLDVSKELIEDRIAELTNDARKDEKTLLCHPPEVVEFTEEEGELYREWLTRPKIPRATEATLIAYDPPTFWAVDPKHGMFQKWQVEEAERALGFVAASSNSEQALRQQATKKEKVASSPNGITPTEFTTKYLGCAKGGKLALDIFFRGKTRKRAEKIEARQFRLGAGRYDEAAIIDHLRKSGRLSEFPFK